MQKLFKILLVGLAFLALNVGTVAAQTGMLPMADDSSRPIGEGGEAGGPAATDMSDKMINDGGFGANSAAEHQAKSTEGNQICVFEYNEGRIDKVPSCVWENGAWVMVKE